MTLISEPTNDASCTACEEGSRFLSRRRFFALAGATGLVTATTLGGARVGLLDPVARALTGAPTDTLVVISLRGGMDGMSVVVPTGDPVLPTLRSSILVPQNLLKQVDSMFGLHPALAPLFPLWDAGKVAAVHAVGMAKPNRSHFSAMEEMERAAPNSALRTGWIDRTIGLVGTNDRPFAATVMGSTTVPTSMLGPQPEFTMRSIDGVVLDVDQNAASMSAWRSAVTALHAGQRPEAATPTLRGLGAVDDARAVPAAGTGYPNGGLGAALRDVARLVKDPNSGMRVATVDFGGWDMHENLGTATAGWMRDKLNELALAMAAFAADLGPALDQVTVVTLSEFGRTIGQNGTGGTDHGYGNAVFVMGGGVRGGKVYGRWPGLPAGARGDEDLSTTTDYRTIIAEVLSARCGVSNVDSVLPGTPAERLGLVTPR